LDKTQHAIVQSYLAKARDKAHVARELLVKGHWDDAVSRAYYAAFHAAQAALLTEGQRGESHQRGCDALWHAVGEDREI